MLQPLAFFPVCATVAGSSSSISIDTAAIDEYVHRAAFVPNTGRRLTRAIGLDASATFQIDPDWLIVCSVCGFRFFSYDLNGFEVIVVVG